MNRQQAIDFLKYNPVKYARLLGFDKLGDIHNDWIIDMVRGKDDTTLQGHRGSFKTTCVSFALSELIILLPRSRTMFLRKTDGDVKEIIKQVQKILSDPHTLYLAQVGTEAFRLLINILFYYLCKCEGQNKPRGTRENKADLSGASKHQEQRRQDLQHGNAVA